MITLQQSQYLLDLPKHIVEDNNYVDRKSYTPTFPIDDRIYLASKVDEEFSFFLAIWQSSKPTPPAAACTRHVWPLASG